MSGPSRPDGLAFLTGSEMRDRIRTHDWSASPLGPPQTWSRSLRSALTICMNMPTVSAVHWGPELRIFYNDAYAPALAERHPWALGKPFSQVWAEIWDVLGPQIATVLETGLGFSTERQLLKMHRRGELQDTWWVYSFSPLYDDDGSIAGIFVTALDETETHVAQRAQENSEARFRALVNASSDVVYQMSADWSEMRLLDGRGLLADTLKPYDRWPDDYILPEDRVAIFAVIDEAVRTKTVFELEHRVRQSDGQIGWTASRAVPVLDDHGELIEWFGMAVDVTARKQGEAAAMQAGQVMADERDRLVATEQRLQLALSAGRGIGTWDWDVPNDRVFADARFARLYGVDPERARAGAPIAEFFGGIHPDDVERVQASVATTLRAGGLFSQEYRLPNADGTSFWVVAEGRCVLDEHGQAQRFAGVSFDITDRKAEERRRRAVADLGDRIRDIGDPTELALEASMILGRLLEVSRASYGTIDPVAETLIVEREYLAPGVETLAGTLDLRDYGDFIDDMKLGSFIVIPDVRLDSRTAAAAEALIARSAASFVNVPVLELGKLVAVLFLNSALPRQWSDEDLALVQEIAERTRTATERLRAVHGLQLANDTLESKVTERTSELETAHEALRQSQKMEAVGQLTGGLAHDFNNLMTIIRSSADFLRRPDLPEERRVRYVEAISETVDRASNLTNQLLAFARRQPLTPRVFDVGAQVQAVAGLIRPLVGGRVEIVVNLPAASSFASADIGQFETAMINLAVNGRDAMEGEGRLTFAVEQVDEIPPLRSHPAQPGRFVAVSVTDTGSGIAPDRLEAVFEPFYTTKEVGKGTGLGLSQAFGFSKQSGGEIDVSSTLGKGSSFTIYLPWAEESDVVSKTTVPHEAFRGPEGHCVLVVEDNKAVGEFSTEMLHDLGYKTRWVGSAREALAVLAADSLAFDLVFSDVVMPGMDGLELAGTVRDSYPDLPVVLTSGYSHVLAENGQHGFELVRKPYSVEALARVLRAAIVERGGQGATEPLAN